jgi:hypothetical protein
MISPSLGTVSDVSRLQEESPLFRQQLGGRFLPKIILSWEDSL